MYIIKFVITGIILIIVMTTMLLYIIHIEDKRIDKMIRKKILEDRKNDTYIRMRK